MLSNRIAMRVKSRWESRSTSNTARPAGSECEFTRRRNWNRLTGAFISCASEPTTARRRSGSVRWDAPWCTSRGSWSGCGKKLAAVEAVQSKPRLKQEVMESLASKAIQFRRLHRGLGGALLANAGDVARARVFEDAGFPAIATTSAGIA